MTLVFNTCVVVLDTHYTVLDVLDTLCTGVDVLDTPCTILDTLVSVVTTAGGGRDGEAEQSPRCRLPRRLVNPQRERFLY